MTTPSSFFTGMIWVAQRKFEPKQKEITVRKSFLFDWLSMWATAVADTESRNYEAQSIFKPQHSRFIDILTLLFSINTLWHSGILFQIKLLTQAGLAEKWGWKGQQGLWEETHWSWMILYIQTCGKCPSQFSTVKTLQTAYLKPNISRLFKSCIPLVLNHQNVTWIISSSCNNYKYFHSSSHGRKKMRPNY